MTGDNPVVRKRAAAVSLLALSLALLAEPASAQTAQTPPAEAPSSTVPTASDPTLPVVEPVIPDEEFEQAIPKLDPKDDALLDAPLESIEEFERRMDAQEAGATGIVQPVTPILTEERKTDEIEDAPIRDAELTKPLPPIGEFEVVPTDVAQTATDDDDEDASRVAYKVEIEGLDAANKETPTGLRSMFNDLSALKDGNGKASNAAMVQARLTEDAELMKTILASEGWYSPVITTRLDVPTSEAADSLAAVITVDPGQRYSLSSITIDADPTVPPDLIQRNIALKVGEPIVATRVQGAEAQVALALPQEGYPFATVGQRSILLDRETGEGDYTLPVEVGPRARFGGFTTEGKLAFDADHVDVLARFERGDLYDSRKVDDLRKALIATSLFSTVAVEPERTGESAGDDTEFVTVNVRQEAGPPRTIAGTLGYGSGEGFKLEGTWTHRNMFPPEGALIAHGVAGTKEQGAGVTFRRANAGRRDRTFELVAEALHSDYDAYSAYTGRLATQWRYSSTPIWQKRFTYSFGAELLATSEKDFDFDLGDKNRRTYYIAGLNGLAALDFTDDLLDPTTGFRASLFAQPEGSLDNGFNLYVKSQLDASGYFPVGDGFVLAGRVRLGTIQGAARYEIAPSRRFYSGGGGSVRGYAYQGLGPQDPTGDPIGGRSLNEASAEVRYRFGNFGVVGFVDAGQSYAQTMPQFSDIRIGAGIGARYYTNFGPMRIDLATPINRRPGENRFNLYISIGQAF